MSTSVDNDVISLNFRYCNIGNKNILFAIEIFKDKTVSDLEKKVRKKLGPINCNNFLRQIYPEEKPMQTEDRIFSYFNKMPDDEDRNKILFFSPITPYTPASTSTTVAKNETVSLADEIKKYKMKELMDFLYKEEDLNLSEKVFEILDKKEVNGQNFLKITEEKLHSVGLTLGPATRLADFAKKCKEKKLRAFSSYKSLKEVLAKYGIGGNGTDTIPLFSLQTHKIQDSDEHFKQCMAKILVRLKNYGTLVVDNLEAMRNEYVVTILHSTINITRNATGKELSIRPEYEVIGDKSIGRVDYVIKDAENLICITEDKPQRNVIEDFAQNIKQLESSYETNKRKRKRDDGDDFNYLYSIVTTARDWHFLLYTSGKISQGSKLLLSIEFLKMLWIRSSWNTKHCVMA